jgi:hypothetical protein
MESLTVRPEDYHPIGRTIEFRDNQTIEIAELDYDVLPGGGAPDASSPAAIREPAPHITPHVPVPVTALSPEQLDLAELDARLALHRIRADFGEQIELARAPEGVTVTGVVDSEDRRREIVGALAMIAHVRARIETVSDLANAAPSASVASSAEAPHIQVVNTVSQPSPLLLLCQRTGRSPDEVAQVSDRLLNASQGISQHALAIRELKRHFADGRTLNAQERADYDELIAAHRTQLGSALAELNSALTLLQVPAPSAADDSGHRAVSSENEQQAANQIAGEDMEAAAKRSLALVRELTSGSGDNQRDAALILADLRQTSGSLSQMLR